MPGFNKYHRESSERKGEHVGRKNASEKTELATKSDKQKKTWRRRHPAAFGNATIARVKWNIHTHNLKRRYTRSIMYSRWTPFRVSPCWLIDVIKNPSATRNYVIENLFLPNGIVRCAARWLLNVFYSLLLFWCPNIRRTRTLHTHTHTREVSLEPWNFDTCTFNDTKCIVNVFGSLFLLYSHRYFCYSKTSNVNAVS